jgi:hypothetical protein
VRGRVDQRLAARQRRAALQRGVQEDYGRGVEERRAVAVVVAAERDQVLVARVRGEQALRVVQPDKAVAVRVACAPPQPASHDFK